MIYERDRRTDGQTNGRTDGHCMTAIAALMHSIARQLANELDKSGPVRLSVKTVQVNSSSSVLYCRSSPSVH